MDYLAANSSNYGKTAQLFEDYHTLLIKANKRINLFSRKILPEDIWLNHFYDSLLPLLYGFDFSGKKVLDFGTGAGLPGIPLAIMQDKMIMHLLDSRLKKIEQIEIMIKKLDLDNCYVLCKRLEEIGRKLVLVNGLATTAYDVIVCRSVAITNILLKTMMSLLNDTGYVILYKAKRLEKELVNLETEIFDGIDFPEKERKLIKIKKQKVLS